MIAVSSSDASDPLGSRVDRCFELLNEPVRLGFGPILIIEA